MIAASMKPLVSLVCEDTDEFVQAASAGIKEHTALLLTGGAADGDHSTFYKKVADAMGDFHFKDEDPLTGALDRVGWLDMRYDQNLAADQPYRYGYRRMSLHIDVCYSDVDFDIIFFYCERPADFGGATTVIDGNTVVEYLRQYDEGLLAALVDTPVVFSKGARSRTDYIIALDHGSPRFNWNITRVSPENPAETIEMAQRFDSFCEDQLVDGGVVTPCRLEAGDAIFLHNRLTLHGRCSFWGRRHLMKGAISLTPPART